MPLRYRVVHSSVEDDLAVLGPYGDLTPQLPTPFAMVAPADSTPVAGMAVGVYGYASRAIYDVPPRIPCYVTAPNLQYARVGLAGPIHLGDSGGPVVGTDDLVVGVVFAKEQNEGLALFIPASLILQFLKRHRIVHHIPGSAELLSSSEPVRKAPVFVHEYNLPSEFVARDVELQTLADVLCGSQERPIPSHVVVVSAIGGVGKSCLCRELIQREKVAARFSRVIWFSFYDAPSDSEDSFLREVLTQGFQWTDPGRRNEDPAESVRLRLALTRELDLTRALLVLDGLEVAQHTDDPTVPNYGGIRPTWGQVSTLLRHALNAKFSAIMVSSRVPLRQLETLKGYFAISLDRFSSSDGAILLRSLGVQWPDTALASFAEDLGGHALSLVAAGRYVALRKIRQNRIRKLLGDPAVFRATPEGEKVQRICSWHRADLNEEQQYFLTRLSLLGRSVSSSDYPVLVRHYRPTTHRNGPSGWLLNASTDTRADFESDESSIDVGHEGLSEPWHDSLLIGSDSSGELETTAKSSDEIDERIIIPLVERGLIDRLEGASGIRLAAHPLMKLAYSTWLDPASRKRAHEDWARAAEAAPKLFFSADSAETLEELQPLIEATEQYLLAGDWRRAWRLFSDRNTGLRIGQLGHYEVALKHFRAFERKEEEGAWDHVESAILFDRMAWNLGHLDRDEEELVFRRKLLVLARQSIFPRRLASDALYLVVNALASNGLVIEAVSVQASDLNSQAILALAQGRYAAAAKGLKRIYQNATGHDRTVVAQRYAEALYRGGHLKKAADVLSAGLQVAKDSPFTCCRAAILSQLVGLELRRGDVESAQRWAAERAELRRQLALDDSPDPWLLASERNFEGALLAVESKKSDVASTIRRHVDRARIFQMQGDAEAAAAEIDAAKRGQQNSGYRQVRNDIVEIQRQL